MLSLFLALLDSETDRNKFTYIYQNFNNLMYSTIVGILESESDAESALSNSYYKVLDCINTIDISNFKMTKRYILKIARSCAYDIYRDRLRQNKLIQKCKIQDEEQFSNEVEKEIEKNESRNAVLSIVIRMPSIYREIVIAVYYANLTLRDAAKMLDIPYETAKTRLRRAKIILKKEFEENDII